MIDNVNIEQLVCTKFLGVIIDENLMWKEHIAEVEKKISKNIGLLYRAKNNFESKELCILYNSLVLPYLQYAVVIWGHTYTSRLTKIIKLQKRAIIIVGKSSYYSHSTTI